MIEFIPVKTNEQQHRVELLAREIFHEHYGEYMDSDHVEFYLNKYLTVSATKEKIEKGFHYYLMHFEQHPIGFIAIQQTENTLLIFKLYVLKRHRANKIGDVAMKYISDFAVKNNAEKIELYVNENNFRAQKFYERYGFSREGEMSHHYENGHSEIDYLYSKYV